MNDRDWRLVLQTARKMLGKGASLSWGSESWCAWTTFSSLGHLLTYWKCGFPDENELLDSCTVDGGTWTQSFYYRDIAHLIIPATFYWEKYADGQFQYGHKKQDIELLSKTLNDLGIQHRKSDLVLEIKLF